MVHLPDFGTGDGVQRVLGSFRTPQAGPTARRGGGEAAVRGGRLEAVQKNTDMGGLIWGNV